MSQLPVSPGRWSRGLMHATTMGYVFVGLAAMLLLSPRVLYADPWRFIARFLTTPWPRNVLAADNGHRELFPNLVRVLELQWLQGNQWLQILVGASLACATGVALARGIRRDPAPAGARAAALFFALAGIFWLGNERSLAHGNESVHAYLVTLCLVGGCWWAADGSSQGATRRLGGVLLLGAMAALSFGSGIACFAAFLLVMWLRRASWREMSVPIAGGIAMAVLHLLPGDGGIGAAAGVPSGQHLLRWLSAPFIYAAWPLLDPDVAAQIPFAPVRQSCEWLAQAFQDSFGSVATALWPNALLALAGIAWLLRSTWLVRQDWEASRMTQVALGIAWFALVVGVLVCVSRANYFIEYPGQVVALRYVPWSSLFWSGLAVATVLRAGKRHEPRTIACALVLAAALLPSQGWMALLAYRTQALAESNATAAAVGVLGEDEALGENVAHEIATARPLLRESGTAMFAWPEARLLGQPMPADARPVAIEGLRITAVANRLGAPGYRIGFEAEGIACKRLLVGDATRVEGLAIRQGRGNQWQGWLRQKNVSETGVYAICR